MGKYDLAINIGKSLISDAAKWSKACGKPIVATKPTIFHGINPTATYPASGKTFALNRFCTQEMQEARQMNKITVRQLRSTVDYTFPKATANDLKRLTDNSFEASNLRTIYTNPKDGQVYHLLSEGKTKDGLVKIRILDKDGAFVKNAEVKPKKVIIIDDFAAKFGNHMQGSNSNQLVDMTHGDRVKLIAHRTNPFIEYECIDMAKDGSRNGYLNLYDELAKIQKRIDSGEKIDYISLSIGRGARKELLDEQLKAINTTAFEAKTTNILNSNDVYDVFPLAEFALKNKGKVRIIEAAGNWGKDNINADLSYPNIEGVGALMPELKLLTTTLPGGQIAGISASRNSLYTQHYEQGFFRYTPTKHGLSVFDGRTTDFPIKKEFKDLISKYLGKKPQILTPEENKILFKLRNSANEAKYQKYKELRAKLITQEEENELRILRQKAKIERREKSGVEYQKKFKEFEFQLDKKVKDNMKDYTNEYELPYKQAVEKLIREEKLATNGLGEYYIPDISPYNGKWQIEMQTDKNGLLQIARPHTDSGALTGTSFATPTRTARLALNDMLRDVI